MSTTHDVCVIGAGGFVGRTLVRTLRARGLRVLRLTSRTEDSGQPDTLVWNYRTGLPRGVVDAPVVVNCSKPSDGAQAVQIIERLARELTTQQHYVHLSSNAIFAKARGPWRWLLAGDDYIRIKRLEARRAHAAFRRRPHLVVYPGVLLGDGGGWDAFLKEVRRARHIHGLEPADARSECIPIEQFCDQLADALDHRATGDLRLPEPDEPTPTWSQLIRSHASPHAVVSSTPVSYLFFRQPLKEATMRLLAMRLLPDALALAAFGVLRKKVSPGRSDADTQSSIEHLHIEGMTKFYIGQAPK